MKLALAALLLLSSGAPAMAGPYESQPGYSREQKCYKKVYREEYVPGTMKNPGYVRTYKKRVKVPCETHNPNVGYYPYQEQRYSRPVYHTPAPASVDNNDCSGGTVAGGILGGGAAAAMSRGEGRWWAIPLGIVGGAMVGCQVDGG
ncbi:MAG: hypothetical protein CMM03_03430 [Rhodopirellula sp.]|jgi:hypothetical protein|nr:hypothetical protein [Rhodopirellula sp.]